MKGTAGELASSAATAILVVCAIAVTVITVRREFRGNERGAGGPQFEAQADWNQYAAVGQRMGPANARVVLVEFSDFQCPVCATFADRLHQSMKRFPNDFAVVLRHFPLSIHPQAVPAAIASECAAKQGAFEAMYFALFANRDSLGKTPWRRYAADAHVPDLAAFDRCLSDSTTNIAVQRDADAAKRLPAHGTPTLLINGLRHSGILPQAVLDSMIQSAIALKTAQR